MNLSHVGLEGSEFKAGTAGRPPRTVTTDDDAFGATDALVRARRTTRTACA